MSISVISHFCYPDTALLAYLPPKTFELGGFPIFWRWAYLLNVIPETPRAH